MAISVKNFLAWVKSYYDKIIALFVLVLLVGSLLYLAVQIGMMHTVKARFDQEIRNYKPKYPNAEKLQTKAFTDTMAGIEHPVILTSEQWTNAMVFTPERRVWCLGCRKPMPADAEKCPFCKTVPVFGEGMEKEIANKNKDKDTDGDGIPDVWETKYGLDLSDPSDAEQDLDKDGFSNLEEYSANPQTDPTDSKSHPPFVNKLRLVKVDQDPFKLRFKGTMKGSDGKLSFQLNLRGGGKTYFAQLDETVEGFKLMKHEPKEEQQEKPGMGKVSVDVSELTLQRGDKMIVLIKDKDVQWDEYTAQLLFAPDNKGYTVKIGDVVEVKNEKFKVISVDMAKQTVLIESVITGEKTTIERYLENKSVEPVQKKGQNLKPAAIRRRTAL